MSERKLSVYIGCPAYSGNSGISSIYPEVARWLIEVSLWCKGNPRVCEVHLDFHSDTPITMVRNLYVERAKKAGCQLLLMCDSDQNPNFHVGEGWYKPFFPEAFNAIYEHYDKGPLVIGAPYCGSAEAGQNIFVFEWRNQGIFGDETSFSLEQYTRETAARMTGIQPCAALPTGMILFDMRIFDMLENNRKSKQQVLEEFKDGKIDKDEALRCIQDGHFYYEWTDHTASQKASTEDVTITRDMSIVGEVALGYNPVMCAWDSWIGHMKPYCTGKPRIFSTEQVGGVLKRAVLDNRSYRDRLVRVENKALLQALKESNGTPTA